MALHRVLVIDDDPGVRRYLTTILQHAGIASDEAKDGRAGLEHLATTTYDAIVLDLSMPVLDGNGVLRSLRATRRDLCARTIVLTATPDRLEHHDVAVLTKPVTPSALLQALARISREALVDA